MQGMEGDEHLLRLTREMQAEEIKICLWKNTDDGYRWEGYGSRRVSDKSTQRKSYYRCLNVRAATPCNAKKILQEHPTDPQVVMVTYKGRHNHQPLKDVTQLHPILKILEMPLDIQFQSNNFASVANKAKSLPLELHSLTTRSKGTLETTPYMSLEPQKTRTEPLDVLLRRQPLLLEPERSRSLDLASPNSVPSSHGKSQPVVDDAAQDMLADNIFLRSRLSAPSFPPPPAPAPSFASPNAVPSSSPLPSFSMLPPVSVPKESEMLPPPSRFNGIESLLQASDEIVSIPHPSLSFKTTHSTDPLPSLSSLKFPDDMLSKKPKLY